MTHFNQPEHTKISSNPNIWWVVSIEYNFVCSRYLSLMGHHNQAKSFPSPQPYLYQNIYVLTFQYFFCEINVLIVISGFFVGWDGPTKYRLFPVKFWDFFFWSRVHIWVKISVVTLVSIPDMIPIARNLDKIWEKDNFQSCLIRLIITY